MAAPSRSTADEEMARLKPVLPAAVKFGAAGVDRQQQGQASPPGRSTRARRSSTTSGACSAIPTWRKLVAARGVPVIVMHNRDAADRGIDIIADVAAFFARSLDIAEQAGIARDKIVLDPGIGFGKTPEQSIACIARLGEFARFGLPLLVGASRKRFINSVTPSPPDERIGGSIASHLEGGEERRGDRARARRRRNRAGAARHRGHRGGAMSDTIFINGLSLHAYHGVMPYEGKVGQTFSIDLELDDRPVRRGALRQGDRHRVLRQGRGMRERRPSARKNSS